MYQAFPVEEGVVLSPPTLARNHKGVESDMILQVRNCFVQQFRRGAICSVNPQRQKRKLQQQDRADGLVVARECRVVNERSKRRHVVQRWPPMGPFCP